MLYWPYYTVGPAGGEEENIMKRYNQQPVQARVLPAAGEYLKTRCVTPEGDGPVRITVGRGEEWTPLACKEVYGKAVKTALEQECGSCLFDLTAAAELGQAGICAALEGIYGGGYKKKFTLSDRWEPELELFAGGEGWTDAELETALQLTRSIMTARNLVNRPANLLTPERFAKELEALMEGLPVQVQIYHRDELAELGLKALLAVGDSSGNPPELIALRYTGAPESAERLGFVGKGVTVDTGGYSLKARDSMEGIKGDMAGAAAVSMAVRALAASGAAVNVTAVIPACENRISRSSALPGDVIGSLSGRTIEILNTDAEGRLILADGLTWAIRQEHCTRLVDVATLTGAIWAMLGYVAAGVMASDDGWYERLEAAAALSGEKYWRMPAFREYEKLIESDLADVRNTSKDGCGSITAGLFLKGFTEKLPWLHLDIAGTADGKSPQWQHQVSGATGTAVSTLYYLAAGLAQD